MRAFISLNLNEEKKDEVFEIQSNVKKLLDSSTMDSIKWEGRNKFHQTIFFLLCVLCVLCGLISSSHFNTILTLF